jgi:hypothetical protein
MEYLFGKKNIGEDVDSHLVFLVKRMNANSLKKLGNLCERNPQQCRAIRKELCRDMFMLNGYPVLPIEPCSMYVKLITISKASKAFKSNLPNSNTRPVSPSSKDSIKPTKDLILAVALLGDEETKTYFRSCDYEVPFFTKTSWQSEMSDPFSFTPSIKDAPTIKSSSRKQSRKMSVKNK